MTRRSLWLIVLTVAALADLILPAQAAPLPHDRPRIAILDFEAAPGGWTLPPPRIGEIIAELMLDRLVAAGQFHVLDGQWLRRGAPTGDVHTAQEALLANARDADVDYIVLGSITQFSMENRQRTLGGGGLVQRLPILGAFQRQASRLAISILVRLVDVRSGEVMTTATGDGLGARNRVSAGTLVSRLPMAGGFSSGASQSRDAQLDEATRHAVDAASVALLNAASRLVTSPQ